MDFVILMLILGLLSYIWIILYCLYWMIKRNCMELINNNDGAIDTIKKNSG
jgi:hypothetical protein